MRVQRRGLSQRLKKTLETLSNTSAKIGIFDTAEYPDGTPVAYIASIHEFGYPEGNIPARPFFRTGITENKGDWRKGFAELVKSAVAGKVSIEQAFEQLGSVAAGNIQESIVDGEFEPLKEATTYARRARRAKPGQPVPEAVTADTTPLRDTKTLLKSISYQVNEGEIVPAKSGGA